MSVQQIEYDKITVAQWHLYSSTAGQLWMHAVTALAPLCCLLF